MTAEIIQFGGTKPAKPKRGRPRKASGDPGKAIESDVGVRRRGRFGHDLPDWRVEQYERLEKARTCVINGRTYKVTFDDGGKPYEVFSVVRRMLHGRPTLTSAAPA